MGWLLKHYKKPVTNRSLCSPFPKQPLGGELMFPSSCHLLLPSSSHSFPAGSLALLGITAQKYKVPRGDLLSLLVGGVGQGTDWLGVSLNFFGGQLPCRLS